MWRVVGAVVGFASILIISSLQAMCVVVEPDSAYFLVSLYLEDTMIIFTLKSIVLIVAAAKLQKFHFYELRYYCPCMLCLVCAEFLLKNPRITWKKSKESVCQTTSFKRLKDRAANKRYLSAHSDILDSPHIRCCECLFNRDFWAGIYQRVYRG